MEELCHGILRHAPTKLETDPTTGLLRREFNASQEEEAYDLGATILLPKELVQRKVNRGRSASQIGAEHKCSRQLVEYRIRRCRLWDRLSEAGRLAGLGRCRPSGRSQNSWSHNIQCAPAAMWSGSGLPPSIRGLLGDELVEPFTSCCPTITRLPFNTVQAGDDKHPFVRSVFCSEPRKIWDYTDRMKMRLRRHVRKPGARRQHHK